MFVTGAALRKAHETDAGFDLVSPVDCEILGMRMAFIETEHRVLIPKGCVGLVCPRSGLARKAGIGIVNAPGIIDCGYSGRIGVTLFNHSPNRYRIRAGDRIAQLVVVRLADVLTVEMDGESFDRMEETYERGAGGFGSSGR